MADCNDRVVETKTALFTALGDSAAKYLSNMKLWLKNKRSKEEFDADCRKFLSSDTIHLHNCFLIAILNKIDAVRPMPKQDLSAEITLNSNNNSATITASGGSGSSGTNRSRKRKRAGIRAHNAHSMTFEPYDVMDFVKEEITENIRPAASGSGADSAVQVLPTQRYSHHELFLPDQGFILGRFLIGAWETGLNNVEDAIAEYVMIAVQNLLKDIIASIIMKKKHYKVTGEGSFYYDVGAPLRDPFLRNTVTRQKVDDAPLELDKEITSPNFMRRSQDEAIFLAACEEMNPKTKLLITLSDARSALKDRSLICSHAIYAINMERITQIMN